MPPANKRRKLAPGQVEELNFDDAARQEYLSGFHKRKQARIQSARELAVKRDREERVRERRQIREQRREELQQHIDAVNAELKKQNRVLDGDSDHDSDNNEGTAGDEDQDGSDGKPEFGTLQEREEEYVDEDKYTTVTVEPMGDFSARAGSDDEGDTDEAENAETIEPHVRVAKKKPSWSRSNSTSGKGTKAKTKKKFRYESKAERTANRQKQKSKNRAAKARRKGD